MSGMLREALEAPTPIARRTWARCRKLVEAASAAAVGTAMTDGIACKLLAENRCLYGGSLVQRTR